ncbi:c-type cytochrome biogenesis protein CcsB [Desulfofalx alkaliphila]|uniref:c-type cytochrome biogenesis protein CcsB n=1 Tax=Desulfofalx alkaliphila TaxID=105483 RepID=UPI0004E0B9D7|nr:c-type cytochrome biogenesis protein CcsB [Desulfofalx alkaliphila]
METTFNLTAYVLLMAGVVLSLISLWKPNKYLEGASFWSMVLACGALTLALAHRSLTVGRLPFATLYEFTFLFAWGILLFYIIVRRHVKSALLTSLVALCTVILVSYGSMLPSEAKPLMPALQSVWLEVHVITAVIAYGAFGLSFCIGIGYLLKERNPDKGFGVSLPPLEKLDKLMHWSVVVGFPFMTLVLITGAVWAEEVWGHWWSWDPKETWALITWFIYAGYLHARKTRGWQGKRAAVLAVIGFLAVLFTLFGVSFLLPGVHSYV